LGEQGVNIREWEWGPNLRELTPRKLPMHILWGGLLVDALLYGTLVWGIGQALLAGWRKLGVKPGQCRRCGYDRRGLGAGARCPECGEAR